MEQHTNVAFLWDESFLWGLMAYKALSGLGLPFDLVTAKDIQSGIHDSYKMLFVPGFWASNKSKALGESGIKAIQDYVSNGGSYLGFCGGAGLATKAKNSLGLLNVKRRPTKERVPSFSGGIELNTVKHPIWNTSNGDQLRMTDDERRTTVFHAWWPSQLIVEDDDIKVLATYGSALPDSFSSDLNVGDMEDNGSWKDLEEVYGINLDPKRLINELAVVEGMYGNGKVVLSLVHFDTPEDMNGQQVLMNLWDYLVGGNNVNDMAINQYADGTVRARHALPLQNICTELISLGQRNFLWFWRNPMLLQWRRGVRGLEYNTLYIMMKEIAEMLESMDSRGILQYAPAVDRIEALLTPFVEKAKRLLVLERHALQKGHITYEKCDDPEIKSIRSELFSDSKSYGGMFKSLVDEIDSLLLALLIDQTSG
jgi:hypothetical protein